MIILKAFYLRNISLKILFKVLKKILLTKEIKKNVIMMSWRDLEIFVKIQIKKINNFKMKFNLSNYNQKICKKVKSF